jgi:hypothetical protein
VGDARVKLEPVFAYKWFWAFPPKLVFLLMPTVVAPTVLPVFPPLRFPSAFLIPAALLDAWLLSSASFS